MDTNIFLQHVLEIKEKYGSMRIHMSVLSEPIYSDVYRLCSFYENKSVTVCEVCGSAGSIRNKPPGDKKTNFYWIKTLCDKCWTK
jgi:hypothetical protein